MTIDLDVDDKEEKPLTPKIDYYYDYCSLTV